MCGGAPIVIQNGNQRVPTGDPASAPGQAAGGAGSRTGRRAPLVHRRGWLWLAAFGLLGLCAALFVCSDVLERHFFPELSTAWRHFLLTTRSALVTGIGCAVVYFVMRNHQANIERTADALSQRLANYRTSDPERTRFENPNLVRCRDVVQCARVDCPAYHVADKPCWQIMALSRTAHGGDRPRIPIGECHRCEVYLRSCPDGLTRLGESFNSLMFMLDEEAEAVTRMQAQMVEKEKMIALGQLAAGIAHEISNPLSSISSVVQMLKRRRAAEMNGSQLDLIQEHIQRISSTVRQLSGLARPVAERWESVELWTALQDAVSLVSFDRRAKDTHIVINEPGALPRTYALKGQLQQVFINLLLNALDAMPDGGVLTVRADADTHMIRFRFEDTGGGVPAEVGRRIFEPFFTTKEQGKGSGLGLAVSYGIVQKHGGRIDFRDRAEGGTEFTVEIPILTSQPEP